MTPKFSRRVLTRGPGYNEGWLLARRACLHLVAMVTRNSTVSNKDGEKEVVWRVPSTVKRFPMRYRRKGPLSGRPGRDEIALVPSVDVDIVCALHWLRVENHKEWCRVRGTVFDMCIACMYKCITIFLSAPFWQCTCTEYVRDLIHIYTFTSITSCLCS